MTGQKQQQSALRSAIIRPLVIEALRIEGALSYHALLDYIEKHEEVNAVTNNTAGSLGQILRYMRADGLLEEDDKGNLLLTPAGMQEAPTPIIRATPTSTPPANTNGVERNTAPRVQIAEYYRAREGRTVTMMRAPLELEGVFRLELHLSGNWIPVPLFSDTVICFGEDIPKLSPAQEVFRHVDSIRVTYTDGTVREFGNDPQHPITLAPKGG